MYGSEASRYSINTFNRSPPRHKQYVTSREQQQHEVKPIVGMQTHPKHSSARMTSLVERSDELHQLLEHDKAIIHCLRTDVTRTSEEYEQLCHELRKKEDYHRADGLLTTINDVRRKLTELENKLLHYSKENSRLNKGSTELKRRILGLNGKYLLLTNKQKTKSSQRNLTKRAKAQGGTMSQPAQSRVMDQDLNRGHESAKAEKSEIEALFSQYQFELDNLIKTEEKLREIINELQTSHVTIKIDIQRLNEKTTKSSKKHRRKEVQIAVTKQAHQSSQADVLQQPSQSSSNLDIMTIEARSQIAVEEYRAKLEVKEAELKECKVNIESLEKRNQLAAEAYRSQLDLKEAELKEYKTTIESLEERLWNQPWDANKLNDKFQEQLVQTNQQHETKLMIITKEKDERIEELEINLCNMNDAINKEKLQHEHQIGELHKRLEKLSNDNTSISSQLNKANENCASTVAQKDLELKKSQKRIKEISAKYESQIEQLREANKSIEAMRAISAKYESQKEQLREANKSIETMRAELIKNKEAETCNERLKEISSKYESQKEQLSEATKGIETMRAGLAVKDREIETYKKRLEVISTDSVSKLSKATKANETCKLLLTQKDLQLRKSHDRLNEISAKYESQKEQLNETSKTIEKMRAELSVKDREIETYNNRLTEKLKELRKTKEKFELVQKEIEELKNDNTRCENFPKNELMDKLMETEKELKKYQESLLRYEEKSFKFTNAFTSAGEGSVLDISKRYRHLQHNKRAAAARAIKKVYKIDAREHLCKQVMCAYETAKSVVLREAMECLQNNLFKLVKTEDEMKYHNHELMLSCKMLLNCIQEDETIHRAAINQIYQKLITDGKPLQPEVEDYYQSLAELTWCAVARPIPMIIAISPNTYCKACHELKDGEDVEDGSAISYIYPVLYSSNEYPHQVAQEGKVVLTRNNDN